MLNIDIENVYGGIRMLKTNLNRCLFMVTILIAAALIGCGNSNTTTPAKLHIWFRRTCKT